MLSISWVSEITGAGGASHFTGEETAALGGWPVWPGSEGEVGQGWDLLWLCWPPEMHPFPRDGVCVCPQNRRVPRCGSFTAQGRLPQGCVRADIQPCRGCSASAAATQALCAEAPSALFSVGVSFWPPAAAQVPSRPSPHSPEPGGCTGLFIARPSGLCCRPWGRAEPPCVQPTVTGQAGAL